MDWRQPVKFDNKPGPSSNVRMTGHVTKEEKKGYLEAGMNDVLIKTFRMDSLRALMQRPGQPDAFPPMTASRIRG